ncbi:glycosyl hydrolase family 85 [Lecanosticta acicola]|uniref:Glycosyl hydrolase family 85 n=1 Tax=Lecanosticta acicola TaxID=111012 RepID=A0AAI8YXA1_9PEZI|nr:glycosyl hydrolase family 85 [Lecanosticta acicola]
MAGPLKGFAHLESFSELRQWSEDGVRPLQRANTPMFPRPNSKKQPSNAGSHVMLVHDYAGGYNDYEACQGAQVQGELYTCDYLHNVESFVYFSHRLVTIPPPTWTNTCHRNGVKVLGTFIVEPGTSDVRCILEQDAGISWVAERLARIAKHHGFDGWLINIEASFPLLSWSRPKLEQFLGQLRESLGRQGKVVWYDALTTLNLVWYQNTLNSLNLPFALAAGSILTNYAWNPDLARRGKRTAEQSGLGVDALYFGIDAWAQNVQHDTKHSRKTWPSPGGGGTGTGVGMRDLQQIKSHDGDDLEEATLGTGIFAPGWSFEHFPDHRRAIDEAMWLGRRLPDNITCDCGPEALHASVDYEHNGIAEYAKSCPSGTKSFFHTNFQRAIFKSPDGTLCAHLGSQSILPKDRSVHLIGANGNLYGLLRTSLADSPSRCILSIEKIPEVKWLDPCARASLTLADLGISQNSSYQLTVKYRKLRPSEYIARLVVRRHGMQQADLRINLPTTTDITTLSRSFGHDNSTISSAQLEVDVADANTLQSKKTDIVEIHEITIQPKESLGLKCHVDDISLEICEDATNRSGRLVWSITNSETRHHSGSLANRGLPFSEVTGLCSHFDVKINGEEAGRAYALEYILNDHTLSRPENAEAMSVEITAIGFDGIVLGTKQALLAERDAWVVVSS